MATQQDNGTGALPLSEAAARLGISEELVRKRIYRGKLQGHKIDGRWHVVLNDQDGSQIESLHKLALKNNDATRSVSELLPGTLGRVTTEACDEAY